MDLSEREGVGRQFWGLKVGEIRGNIFRKKIVEMKPMWMWNWKAQLEFCRAPSEIIATLLSQKMRRKKLQQNHSWFSIFSFCQERCKDESLQFRKNPFVLSIIFWIFSIYEKNLRNDEICLWKLKARLVSSGFKVTPQCLEWHRNWIIIRQFPS